MKVCVFLLCTLLLAGCASPQVRTSGQWDMSIGTGSAPYHSLRQYYPPGRQVGWHEGVSGGGWWPRFDLGWLFDAPLQLPNPSRQYLNGSRYARYPLPRPGYPFIPPPPFPGPAPFERSSLQR